MAGLRKAMNPFMGGQPGATPMQRPPGPQMGTGAPGGATPQQSMDPMPAAAGAQAGAGHVAPRGQNVTPGPQGGLGGGSQAPQGAPAQMPPQAPMPFNPLPAIPPSVLAQAGGPLGAMAEGMPGTPQVRRRTL